MIGKLKHWWANRWVRLFVKTSVTLVLLFFLFQQITWEDFWPILKAADGYWVAAAIFISLGRNFLAAWRLQVLLLGKTFRVSYWALLKGYYYGFFFNFFLPTAIGGDVVRTYVLRAYTISLKERAGAIVVERILGFLALTLMPLLLMPFCLPVFHQFPYLWTLVAIDAVILLSLLFILFGGVSRSITLFRLSPRGIIGKVVEYVKVFEGYTKNNTSLFRALFLSLLYQFFGIMNVYCLGVALGQELNVIFYILIMPSVWLLSMIPISLNGFGLRETGFVSLFKQVGVPTTVGLGVSAFFVILLVLQALIGGVWLLVSPDKIRSGKLDSETPEM